jgi:hypothetical protein
MRLWMGLKRELERQIISQNCVWSTDLNLLHDQERCLGIWKKNSQVIWQYTQVFLGITRPDPTLHLFS